MKRIQFLSKLKKKGKLELTEPSEPIKSSYMAKSKSNLLSSKILLEHNCLEEATSLSYYSMYNMLIALLFRVGVKCENHGGSIILLKELFGIDNTEISLAKQERIDKQYYTDFNLKKAEVTEAIIIAESFNAQIMDFISKLTNAKIKEYREKFKRLL